MPLSQIWDGLNPTRRYKTDYRNCTQEDLNEIVNQIQLTQEQVVNESNVGGRREVTTRVERNAIPPEQRSVGMVVYVNDDQIDWQLWPDLTNNSWIPYGTIPVYTNPTFSLFKINNQDTAVITGTTLSGSVTFNWATTSPSNIIANSIHIIDETNQVSLLTSLANSGSQAVTLPSSISSGPQTWTISGLDTKGRTFSASFTVIWVTPSDKVYYVRPDGNDSHTGLSDDSSHGWLTLQHAATLVDVGDTVHIRAGTYVGFALGWTGARNGLSGHPISFLADNGVIINYANPLSINDGGDGIDIESSSYITIDGFTITNDSSIGRAGIRASGVGLSNIIIRNCEVSAGILAGIFGGRCSHSLIENNIVHDIGDSGDGTGHGIYWSRTLTDATIRNNTLYNLPGDGIHMNGGPSGPATNCLLENNIIFNCNTIEGGGAIDNDGFVNGIIQNNLIYNVHSAGIVLYNIDTLVASTGNTIVNNTILLSDTQLEHKAAISIRGAALNNIVFNNIIYAPNVDGFLIIVDQAAITGVTQTKFDYNYYLNSTIPYIINIPGSNPTVLTLTQWRFIGYDVNGVVSTTSASFEDFSGKDFHLKSDAPEINTGISSYQSKSAPSTDLEGTSRSTTDVGCYEFNAAIPRILSTIPATNAISIESLIISLTMNHNIDPGTADFTLVDSNDNVIAGSVSIVNAVITFTPTNLNDIVEDTVYTATLLDAQASGIHITQSKVWIFRIALIPSLDPVNLINDVPSIIESTDTTPYELGLRFQSLVIGNVIGVRFYKSINNVGTHVGNVYSSTGVLLGSVTFSGESSSGWQEQLFVTPITILANTTYIISYTDQFGHYSLSENYFLTTKNTFPLVAPANTSDAPNGVFKLYGGFPDTGFNSNNYFVDLLFTGLNPGNGSIAVEVSTTISAVFNTPIDSASVTFTVKDHLNNTITGIVTYDSNFNKIIFTPNSILDFTETYTASISGATTPTGLFVMVGTKTWTFTTGNTISIWVDNDIPSTLNITDNRAIEVGLKFRSSVSGQVIGVKFYKGTSNSGPHVGRLYASGGGSPLAEITFVGETTSGWQRMLFDSPISITADTTYVISYYSVNRFYSITANYFTSSAKVTGPLTALQTGTDGGNGVFIEVDGGGFPTTTFSASNYWVDVIFEPD